MFQEVDAALVALIKDEAIGDADVAIALDVPNRPWFAAVQGLTVNVFLYDVRENAARRDVMYEPVLDEAGRIVGRRAPAMRYDLYYLMSVWGTADPALEHQVMAALLVGLGRHDVFPEARVPEQHRELRAVAPVGRQRRQADDARQLRRRDEAAGRGVGHRAAAAPDPAVRRPTRRPPDGHPDGRRRRPARAGAGTPAGSRRPESGWDAGRAAGSVRSAGPSAGWAGRPGAPA